MSGAQRDTHPLDDLFGQTDAAEAPFALKEQVAERLAAHRTRKSRAAGSSVTPISQSADEPSHLNSRSRSARIAASVAERYAQSQSYRAFLAEEAERAIHQAQAAAEVAALSAKAVVEAQNQLLFELDQLAAEIPLPGPIEVSSAAPEAKPAISAAVRTSIVAPPTTLNIAEASTPVFTVRLYEDVGRSAPEPRATTHAIPSRNPFDDAEGEALDEEIAFRQSPVFEPTIAPVEIPANLIEFPRQLVAARKARPRLAEGPLREEADLAPASAQLRIFEVEATQLSTAPVVESSAPEWSSMVLDAQPAPAPFVEVPETRFIPIPAPQAAPLGLRIMSTMVDGILILTAFLGSVAAFALTCSKIGSPLTINLQTAAIVSVGTLIFLALAYQFLFFTFGEATPGMRYARIGFCTLSDENPTRAQIRRRIFATILAACPMGIGFLWACLDDEGLGWHDRISRMYQRSY